MIDTNAAQFARMGNPWVSERERVEFSAPNRKERRQNRNPHFGKIPKIAEEPRPGASRDTVEAFARAKHAQNFHNRFIAALEGSRTVVAAKEPALAPLVLVVKRDTPIDPLSREGLALEGERMARAAERAKAEAQHKRDAAFTAAMTGLEAAFAR